MTNSLQDNIKVIRGLIEKHQFKEGEQEILTMMCQNPHVALPHNLYGILLEKEHNHIAALKHFRAAYALDPTYIPARYNLEQYSKVSSSYFHPAYSEEDCMEICKKNKDKQFTIEYDEHHIGHIVRER